MLDLLLYLLIGFGIWLVTYVGFFATLEYLIRRGIEDPNVPVYKGPPSENVVPAPPQWNFGPPESRKPGSKRRSQRLIGYDH